MILGLVVVSIVSGGIISVTGYYTPFMIGSSIFMAIGAGLLSTLTTGSGHSMWIGYQIIFGFGVGMGLQQPLIAAQTVLDLPDVPVGTALMIFAQSIGSSIFISVGQNVFTNRLISSLQEQTPDLDPNVVVSAGATGFRGTVSPEDLEGVLFAYNQALVAAFYVAVAMAVLTIVGSAMVEWKNVKAAKADRVDS